MTVSTLLLIYISFRIKQFVCDFLLQTDWMAINKGKPGQEGYKSLLAHSVVHGIGTTLIALIFVPSLWWLGIVDLFVHSVVDRIKGVLTYKNNWTYDKRIFWWSLGFDQEMHNLTHLLYIVFIVAQLGGLQV